MQKLKTNDLDRRASGSAVTFRADHSVKDYIDQQAGMATLNATDVKMLDTANTRKTGSGLEEKREDPGEILSCLWLPSRGAKSSKPSNTE